MFNAFNLKDLQIIRYHVILLCFPAFDITLFDDTFQAFDITLFRITHIALLASFDIILFTACDIPLFTSVFSRLEIFETFSFFMTF